MAAHDQQSGGQKTFRLARLFHTEDCYRARALTAEELVRRTFIGVDAETFKKLDRQGSYYDITNCEDWHARFAERFQDAPTCVDIARAAERLGYRVRKARGKEQDHFYFLGARPLDSFSFFVASRCVGCECQCDHDAEWPGAGCASCDCVCEGCYCAGGCAAHHPYVVGDTNDPFMNLAETDANQSYRSQRFALNREIDDLTNWHTADCKFLRSFTADELVKLTLKPSRNGDVGFVYYSDWHYRFEDYFETLPTSREVADALMERGIGVSKPKVDEFRGFEGFDMVVATKDALFDSFWLRRSYQRCGDQPCDCLCKLCGPAGCVACDCECEGCFCTGTCADRHPVIRREYDHDLSRAWRILASDRGAKRYERKYGTSWHAQNCTTARWLTPDQIVWLTLKQPEVENGGWVGGPCASTHPRPLRSDCGFHWINEQLMYLDVGPSCVEVADAARRAGIPVVALPKRWPWGRTHYTLRPRRVDAKSRFGVAANPRFVVHKPSCTGCECFCALCDDCSNYSCECAGCVCSARCSTGDCIVHELSSRMLRTVSAVELRLGTKEDMSQGDREVSDALVRLEQEVGITRSPVVEASGDAPPTFKLLDKGYWHQDVCEHPRQILTADELVYVTLKPISDDIIRSFERYEIMLERIDCDSWKDDHLQLFEPEPTCEQLAAAATRLGYQVMPVDGFRREYLHDNNKGGRRAHVTDEHQLHYQFLNAAYDWRLLGGDFAALGRLDEERCNGRCRCGCSHDQWEEQIFGPCECAGCYCRRTCVPAGVEE